MENLLNQIEAYLPREEQEAGDRALMLYCIDHMPDLLTRDNPAAHFTASAWIVNPARDSVLMVWHNIYRSWSWTGGHADGDADLLAVALREAREETGAKDIHAVSNEIYSLEAIHVPPHIKRSVYISTHLHLNLTFLLECPDDAALAIKPDENSGVRWMGLGDAIELSNEDVMKVIYRKLNTRLRDF